MFYKFSLVKHVNFSSTTIHVIVLFYSKMNEYCIWNSWQILSKKQTKTKSSRPVLRGRSICIFFSCGSQGEIKDSWDLWHVPHIFHAIFPYANESPQWFIRLVMLSGRSLHSLPSACWDHRPHEPGLSENILHKSSAESDSHCNTEPEAWIS